LLPRIARSRDCIHAIGHCEHPCSPMLQRLPCSLHNTLPDRTGCPWTRSDLPVQGKCRRRPIAGRNGVGSDTCRGVGRVLAGVDWPCRRSPRFQEVKRFCR